MISARRDRMLVAHHLVEVNWSLPVGFHLSPRRGETFIEDDPPPNPFLIQKLHLSGQRHLATLWLPPGMLIAPRKSAIEP